MRIKLFPADETACGSYRMIWPARALDSDDVQVCLPGEFMHVENPGCDIAVFQRPTSMAIAEGIPLLQQRGVRVVVELDDDYRNIPVDNIARDIYDPKRDPRDNWHWLTLACQRADRVVVTTQELARRYGSDKAVVVPNYVPERYLSRVEENATLRLGWAGNMDVHASDLSAVGPGVSIALNASGAEFLLVGAASQREQVRRELSLFQPPVATGWAELEDYAAILSEIDVGIVPLADNLFNESKSYLKGLEYAALGIPFVASATEPYRELAAMGAGLIAERRKHWGRHLTRLLTDASFRADQADSAFAVAQANTIEGNAWRFMEAWNSL